MANESMLERVAKAIYQADDVWSEAYMWPNMASEGQSADNYRRIAKAAIEEMREPAVVMQDAGLDANPRGRTITDGDLLMIYRAMIDAALQTEIASPND